MNTWKLENAIDGWVQEISMLGLFLRLWGLGPSNGKWWYRQKREQDNLRRKKKQQRKFEVTVGREEDGSSSNQPELAAFYWHFVTRWSRSRLCSTTSHCWMQSIGELVQVERQCWWMHLTRIFWQQPSRYYERGLQRGQQLSWSKWKRTKEN